MGRGEGVEIGTWGWGGEVVIVGESPGGSAKSALGGHHLRGVGRGEVEGEHIPHCVEQNPKQDVHGVAISQSRLHGVQRGRERGDGEKGVGAGM